MSRTALVACLVGCGATARAPREAALGDDITLYRDWAVVHQRKTLDMQASTATIAVRIASGVRADQVLLIDRGGLRVTAIRANEDRPNELALEVSAPHPGRYAIVLGYLTDHLVWDVAYTMTTTAARDRAEVRGALAIRNTTGIVLHAAGVHLIDAEVGSWRERSALQLASSLAGGTRGSTPPATPRELGAIEIGDGETRVELLQPAWRAMSSVLVYDPIGTKLDNPGATPLRDARMGTGPASSRVTESFEVKRDPIATAGLPAGPVRLLERRADRSLVVLGEARLFDAATRVADVDTIAVGTAADVTGARERRELTIDDDGRRIVEEFVITLDNKRARPVEVLVREHLYRGQNWTLAYPQGDEGARAAKEGPQQISLRTHVAARSQAKILYVVVYTWGQ